MLRKRSIIPVSKALEKLLDSVSLTGIESVYYKDAFGRILAEPIVASHDIPSFHRSAYDGYAVRSEDTFLASGDNRKVFTVKEQIGAGQVAKGTIAGGEAVRIMTGAAMPEGADAVVMLEQTVAQEGSFTIRKPFRKHENISLQGEDAKKGEMLISSGEKIGPGIIALFAALGYTKVKVSKKPVVGILSTGTELLDAEEELQPGKIRNSNGPMIMAQLLRMGLPYREYGIMADDLESCYSAVENALKECDCLITTGGVSVGDYDYMPAVYDRLNAQVLFDKVSMRPGSVTTAAKSGEKLLFGLSGNPSACFTGFELFVRPVLLKMMGAVKIYLPYTKAILKEDFRKANPFTRFIRGVYSWGAEGAEAVPAGFNKSSAVTSIAKANCLIVLPGGTKGFEAGMPVDILLLGQEEGSESWHL